MDSQNLSADYNLRIAWPFARFIEDTYGVSKLEQICQALKLNSMELDGRNAWMSDWQLL